MGSCPKHCNSGFLFGLSPYCHCLGLIHIRDSVIAYQNDGGLEMTDDDKKH